MIELLKVGVDPDSTCSAAVRDREGADGRRQGCDGRTEPGRAARDREGSG